MISLQLIEHPFNITIGLKSIGQSTKNLILGSFPPFEVTEKQNFRMEYYYGSNANKFWDIFFNALDIDVEITVNKIETILEERNFGILDIVKTCYRKNGNLSSDKDLDIIEQENLIPILNTYTIKNIYCTSKFVFELLLKQIISEFSINKNSECFERQIDGFDYFEIIREKEFFWRIFQLYSPSPNGIRGIKKKLNIIKSNESPENYRLRQYRTFLNFQ